MSNIQITVFENAEQWLIENLTDMFSDTVSAVRPTGRFRPKGLTLYKDIEAGTKKKCSMQDHVNALQKLCEQIGRTLHVGMIKSPYELLEPENWDIEVVDAYWQLVYYGEVIYG